MAVPKIRKSKSKTMMRRRHNDKRSFHAMSKCPECNEIKIPHRVCPHCGTYKGRVIVKKD